MCYHRGCSMYSWIETIDIFPSIYLASEVLNPQSVMTEVNDWLQGGVQLTTTTVQVLCMYREKGRYGKKPSRDESGIVEMGNENAGKTKVMMMSRTAEECKNKCGGGRS